MNRMRCKTPDGTTWTMVRVRELRERLGVAAFDPKADRVKTVTVDEAARRLGICVGSVYRLIREDVLPATEIMPSAPWQIPFAALSSQQVAIGVRNVIDRSPAQLCETTRYQDAAPTRHLSRGMHYVARFRRRAKVIYWDGTGLCVFAKRLRMGVSSRPGNAATGRSCV